MTRDATARVWLALTDAQATRLASSPADAAAIDARGLGAIVIGLDAVTGARGQVIDAHATLAHLSAHVERTALLAAAVPLLDHPYNIARRAGSLDLLASQRTGVVIGFDDATVPDGSDAWSGGGLGEAVPFSTASVADAIEVIHELWRAWPFSAVIADRERRIFVDLDKVRSIDHRGVYAVRGPLGAPASPDGLPVLGVYARDAEELVIALSSSAETILVTEDLYRRASDRRGGEVVVHLVLHGGDALRRAGRAIEDGARRLVVTLPDIAVPALADALAPIVALLDELLDEAGTGEEETA